jgi:ABC-2 type transport system permease protein
VNLRHLSTFVWLRWRLFINGVKRAGTANAVITLIFVALALMASLILFIAGVALGALGMPHLPAMIRLFIWAGIIALFLFFWLIGLLTALQRSEAFSLEKVLFLPVSPSGAFLVNYLSSFLSITLILFVPGMIGLAIGDVYSTGPVMLLAFPLLAAFVFVCTALTYQFQGWLASLVSNPRRRRTIVVLLTAGIFILVQVPNMLNLARPWEKAQAQPVPINHEGRDKLLKKLQEGELTVKQYQQQLKVLEKEAQDERDEVAHLQLERVERAIRLVCGILPPGWVALGIADLAVGHVGAALLGTLGLGVIGAFSLMRAYRTTIRMYMLGGSGGTEIGKKKEPARIEPFDNRLGLMEWKLPWVSEYASGVAVAGIRSLLRAPEAKMLMLTPIVMLIMFGGGFASTNMQTQTFGPIVIFGIVGMMQTMMMQFIGNMFGFDRDGFRVFVLSPIPRREILLGKNLALAPLVLGLGLLVVTGGGFVVHLRWDQFLAAYFQLLTMYLLFSLLGNVCAVYAPFMIPSGSLKGARPRLSVVLVQFACMMISPCVVGIPTVLPSGIELILHECDIAKGVPVSLGFSAVFFAASLACYRRILTWQGQLLADREQQILEAVTKKME